MNDKEVERKKILGALGKRITLKTCYKGGTHCGGEIIKAHSISSKRILRAIAENGYLMTPVADPTGSYIRYTMQKQGINKTSVFTGMCGLHDKVFEPIDNSPYGEGDTKQEYLFAYRIAAREYYTKAVQLNAYQLAGRLVSGEEKPVPGFDHEKFVGHEDFFDWMSLLSDVTASSLDMMEDIRLYLNKNYDNHAYHRVSTQVLKFDLSNIAVASGFLLEVGFDGEEINDIRAERMSYTRPIYLTIFPQGNKTFVLVSYLTRNKRLLAPFVEKLGLLSKDEQKVVVSNLIACHCENTFFKPTYYESLASKTKQRFVSLFGKAVQSEATRIIEDNSLNIFE
ncbi:MAG TPA: hypothetical protein VGS28_00485 [Candidatus Saccharimonadales bacterium]|nr:hypothetical protein [Candidatus Saccharimonadales bacterium]